jgi:CubicO group peptidase (beta-lactamase class C family)
LLTHTSGIVNNDVKDYSKGITVPYSFDELIETFRDRPLSFEPGTGWQYTNTEYVLLAYVIEKVSGESYAGYLSRHIFDPLKMHDTGLAPTNAVVRHQAEGYTPENGVLRHRDYFDRSLETGAGGIHSTLADLSRWDQALYTEQLVPKAYLERVFAGNNKGKYGYGWFVKDDDRGRRIYHGGSEPGYSAFLLRRPGRHLLVVVLSNIDEAPVRDIAEGLEKLAPGG